MRKMNPFHFTETKQIISKMSRRKKEREESPSFEATKTKKAKKKDVEIDLEALQTADGKGLATSEVSYNNYQI